MLGCQRLQTCSPLKKLLNKLGNPYQTYVNFHKTHAMATHYGGIGDTSMNNPESHDTDSDSQDNYQEDIHDLENTEPNHLAGLKHLTHKIEQLRQAINDNDNDPMGATNHLEQKLNQLAITLCPPAEPIGEVLNKYKKLHVLLRRNISRELIITRYPYIEWE